MQSTTLLDLKYQHSINRAILTGPCMTLYFRGGGEGCTRNVALAYQKSRAFTVDLTYATQCVHMYQVIFTRRLMWNTRDADMPQAKWGTSKGHYSYTKNVSCRL